MLCQIQWLVNSTLIKWHLSRALKHKRVRQTPWKMVLDRKNSKHKGPEVISIVDMETQSIFDQ